MEVLDFPPCCSISKPECVRGDWDRKWGLNCAPFDPVKFSGWMGAMSWVDFTSANVPYGWTSGIHLISGVFTATESPVKTSTSAKLFYVLPDNYVVRSEMDSSIPWGGLTSGAFAWSIQSTIGTDITVVGWSSVPDHDQATRTTSTPS